MPGAYLIANSCTRFGKQPARSFKDLTREAYLAVLADAGLDSGDQIGNAWLGVRSARAGYRMPVYLSKGAERWT